tara:strand:- start:945 stop:1196 length:252 start_codon:yes stop_codon:yes gene_type:complete
MFFVVKIFWPHRSDAKGFSIENLARKYREKISSSSSSKISNQLLDDNKLGSTKEDSEHLEISQIALKRVHWANRDFSEYREAS